MRPADALPVSPGRTERRAGVPSFQFLPLTEVIAHVLGTSHPEHNAPRDVCESYGYLRRLDHPSMMIVIGHASCKRGSDRCFGRNARPPCQPRRCGRCSNGTGGCPPASARPVPFASLRPARFRRRASRRCTPRRMSHSRGCRGCHPGCTTGTRCTRYPPLPDWVRSTCSRR